MAMQSPISQGSCTACDLKVEKEERCGECMKRRRDSLIPRPHTKPEEGGV